MADPLEADGSAPILKPVTAFEDNLRPAKLMLQVYRLLECGDQLLTDGQFVDRLRAVVKASASEDLIVLQNEIFLGLIRERAGMAKASLKTATLSNLLRQAVVASCTALDAFLPMLLRVHLPYYIACKGREFFPDDQAVREYCKDLQFGLDELLRLLADPNATLYISNKLLGLSTFKYLGHRNGIHVVGAMLGISKPWDAIALQLSRDKKELMRVLDDTVKRRNDIVHRADRSVNGPDAEQQLIAYEQALHGVDTIEVVCLALSGLVERRMRDLQQPASGESDGVR